MQDALQKTHTTLTALKAQEESGISISASASRTAPVDWRKSIRKHAITCLECGDTFKQFIDQRRAEGILHDAARHHRERGILGKSLEDVAEDHSRRLPGEMVTPCLATV